MGGSVLETSTSCFASVTVIVDSAMSTAALGSGNPKQSVGVL